MTIPDPVLSWLLEENGPSIKVRTLTELLDRPETDPEVQAAKACIPGSKTAAKVLALIQPGGAWPRKGPSDNCPELGIGYLGELALDRTHPLVDCAVEMFLSKQYENGAFQDSYSTMPWSARPYPNDQSCYYALTIRGLLRMGYRGDPRVQKAIDFCLSQARFDGGYFCTKSYGKSTTKSCIRGSKNVLLLFAELPEVWQTAPCQRLVAYFLDRRVFFKRNHPDQYVTGQPGMIYPFHHLLGLVEPLYALSKMGFGSHPALAEAWALLEEKRDEQGRYSLDWKMPKCAFDPGAKGMPNPWITLYAYLALKYRDRLR